MTSRWTRVEDLVAVLRKRWERGVYLRAYAADERWQPVTLPVKGPNAAETLEDLGSVIHWAERFGRDSRTAAGRPRFAIEHRTVSSRGLGSNDLPARIRVDKFEQLCSLLGTAHDVQALDEIKQHTARQTPQLVPWVSANPLTALQHRDIWPDVLATVTWIAGRDTSQLYLRHIDVSGVDTKFIEQHQKLLGQLLTLALPAHRLNAQRHGFAQRYGFRAKPDYTRFRLLSPLSTFPAGISELRLRTHEFAALDLPIETVFVVENEISYLAFPDAPASIVVFGEGFSSSTLEAVRWLHRKQVVYWGDIDTHGFTILNRLRERIPTVTSMLMDHATLLAHPNQYVTEPSPTNGPLPHLTAAERSLYEDLIEDRFGPAVRLEQERIRFSLLRRALEPWSTPAPVL